MRAGLVLPLNPSMVVYGPLLAPFPFGAFVRLAKAVMDELLRRPLRVI